MALIFDRMRQDLGYATRGLRRTPAFTTAVVLTLGLGVGANAAMVSLLDRVFVQPPAGVSHPEQVRRLYFDFAPDPGRARRIVWPTTPYPRWRAIERRLGARAPIAGYTPPDSIDLRIDNARYPIRRTLVTPEYFNVLGVRAARGRLFADDERDIAVPAPVVVLSDDFWHRAFDGRPGTIGRTVRIGPDAFTVVGIAPPSFTGIDLNAVDVWMPASNFAGGRGMPGVAWYENSALGWNTIMRSTSASIDAEVAMLATDAVRPVMLPGFIYDSTLRVVSGPIVQAAGPMERSPDVTVAVRVAAIALCVLVIAVANVLNLLLLRALERSREIAVRRALGVSRRRLIGQLTVEAALLAAAGAIAAIACSWWAGAGVRRLVLPRVHWATSPLTWHSVALIAVTAFGVALLGGILPGLQALKPDVLGALRSGTRASTRGGSRIRATLLMVQIALSLVLIVGAGLFARSLSNVRGVDLGYETEDRWFVRPSFDDPPMHSAELRVALPEAVRRLRNDRGVIAIAYASTPPLQGASYRTIAIPGRDSIPRLPGDIGPSMAAVSPDFFSAMGLAIREGRAFTAGDRKGAPLVAIVSAAMARAFWPGESAIGKCFSLFRHDNPCMTIVGVTADVHRYMYLEQAMTQFWVPIAQSNETPRDLIIHVQRGAAGRVMRGVETTMRPLVTNMVGLVPRSVESVLEPQLRSWRLGATIVGMLAVLALFVAAVGTYAVISYGVRQRTHEIGVRIALGAQRTHILDLVLAHGLRTIAAGIVTGIVAAVALGRFIASLLFGVVPNDPTLLSLSAAALVVVGAVACLIPAWRVASVDAATTVRAD
jgi:predicted permease